MSDITASRELNVSKPKKGLLETRWKSDKKINFELLILFTLQLTKDLTIK